MSSMNRPHRKKPLLSYTSVQLGVQTVNMEVDALCIKLLVHVLFLLCAHVQDVDSLILRLEPNRLQFFEYESLIFHCEGSHDSTGLKIVHRSKGELLKCNTTVTSKRSSCTIPIIFPQDSGQYWCESRDGKRSDIIQINVTDGPVILESPISVVEGEAVTLRCRHKTTSSNLSADFYKDGRFIRRSSTGNMSIPSVSKCDEGLYKCSISGGRESAESLMAVQDNQGENASSYSTPWIVMTVLSILLLLVGLLHFGKYIRNKVTVEARRVAADAPSDQVMYAAITIDRTKREQGVSRVMTATVHSAGTNRPLTQEPLYSLIKSQHDG
ncbi:low affinity immunoglobulin gamma Fc region receptor II-like isoform X4 [Labrus mixtus]|uniref:low affinity immunoglobulin gamma Fc region receptor II-like isoform X4 n=1 Tax=Labrus mixtus TaxID=508554 RepID=UPI0029C065F3|nr:low affinity immunoglobulin gamma Fc region receptor II-like isoform X4 [Labrus mixtus]